MKRIRKIFAGVLAVTLMLQVALSTTPVAVFAVGEELNAEESVVEENVDESVDLEEIDLPEADGAEDVTDAYLEPEAEEIDDDIVSLDPETGEEETDQEEEGTLEVESRNNADREANFARLQAVVTANSPTNRIVIPVGTPDNLIFHHVRSGLECLAETTVEFRVGPTLNVEEGWIIIPTISVDRAGWEEEDFRFQDQRLYFEFGETNCIGTGGSGPGDGADDEDEDLCDLELTPEQEAEIEAAIEPYIDAVIAFIEGNTVNNPIRVPAGSSDQAILNVTRYAIINDAGLSTSTTDMFDWVDIAPFELADITTTNGQINGLTLTIRAAFTTDDGCEWYTWATFEDFDGPLYFEFAEDTGGGEEVCEITPAQEAAIREFITLYRAFLNGNTAANPLVISRNATSHRDIFMEVANILISNNGVDASMLDMRVWMNVETGANTVFGVNYITNMTIWIEATVCETTTRHYITTNQTIFFDNGVRVPVPAPGGNNNLPQTGVTSVPLVWIGVTLLTGGAVVKVKKK